MSFFQLSSRIEDYITWQANFAKHPEQPPTPNWPAYTPTNKAIADLAFNTNVTLNNVVVVTNSSTVDVACQLLDTLKFHDSLTSRSSTMDQT